MRKQTSEGKRESRLTWLKKQRTNSSPSCSGGRKKEDIRRSQTLCLRCMERVSGTAKEGKGRGDIRDEVAHVATRRGWRTKVKTRCE